VYTIALIDHTGKNTQIWLKIIMNYLFKRRIKKMKLSECNYGVIVYDKENKKTGHIVGLTTNGTSPIPLVLWADEKLPRGIHYANIQKYRE
jgi:hypothetical protein